MYDAREMGRVVPRWREDMGGTGSMIALNIPRIHWEDWPARGTDTSRTIDWRLFWIKLIGGCSLTAILIGLDALFG